MYVLPNFLVSSISFADSCVISQFDGLNLVVLHIPPGHSSIYMLLQVLLRYSSKSEHPWH